MVPEGLEPEEAHVLRPRRRLIARAVIAALALLVPLAIVVFWLAIPRDTWPFVLLVMCGIIGFGVLCANGARRMRVTVGAHGLKIHRLLGPVSRYSAAEINSLVLVDLYQSGTLDTLPHLYLLDASGEVLLRLRGQVWPRSAMERIIDALDVPLERIPDPLTYAEFRRLCSRRA